MIDISRLHQPVAGFLDSVRLHQRLQLRGINPGIGEQAAALALFFDLHELVNAEGEKRRHQQQVHDDEEDEDHDASYGA